MQASQFSATQAPLSPVKRALAKTLEAAVLVPLSRTLEWTGRWSAVMQKAPKPGGFGDYAPSAADVIVCAFFKSGTTWTLQMALQVACRGEAEFDNIHHVVAWPDCPPGIKERIIPLDDPSPRELSTTGLRIIKTHLPAAKVPFDEAARYLAVVRDPKDVCVSGYHFLRKIIGKPFASMPTWIDFYLSEGFMQGCWATHLASYWALRERPNLLFMTYEEMQADRDGAIARIAAHMGVQLSAGELAKIAELSSFGWMKAHAPQFDPGRVMPWGDDLLVLVRNGQVGSAKAALTAEQRERIDQHFTARLKELGCDFPYSSTYG